MTFGVGIINFFKRMDNIPFISLSLSPLESLLLIKELSRGIVLWVTFCLFSLFAFLHFMSQNVF